MTFFTDIGTKFYNSFLKYGDLWKTVLGRGLVNTLLITMAALAMGLVLGMVFGVVKVLPRGNMFTAALKKFAGFYTTVFRGTPVVVQALIFYYGVFAPMHVDALPVAFLVFGLNSGAYMTESIRSGILAVDIGQMEAGRSLGLPYGATMMKIIMPQAFKNILPALGNEMIALLKDTSIVSFITVTDVTRAVFNIASRNYEFIITLLTLGLIYLIIVMIMTFFVGKAERWLRKSDHR